MDHFPWYKQTDSMQCGVACLQMICAKYGKKISAGTLSSLCFPTAEGTSLKGLSDAATELGFDVVCARLTLEKLEVPLLPCILHWNQNHFVVLYKISKNGKKFWIADPGRGKVKIDRDELEKHWISHEVGGEPKGIAMMLSPNEKFEKINPEKGAENNTIRFLWPYARKYKGLFVQILLGLLLGCVLQLIMPFLTQWIVDIGIKHEDIKLIWLILLGELMIVVGRALTDFLRRWLLLHISMRVNISLVSDFFIKLLRLPMSYFDTKLLGDLLQRMGDHTRVQSFLTNQTLGVSFTVLSLIVFGTVLWIYDSMVFAIFLGGTVVYGAWVFMFLSRRRVIDYDIFEQQANTQNKTYQFITTIQEIKLQDCERRRRWEWEDAQADLFAVQMKSLKLQQTQEAGSIFINELKNILITVVAATAVINGEITLGTMLAIQYIVGQLNSPVEQLMQFAYALQDMKISLGRINEIHKENDEVNGNQLVRALGKCSQIEFSAVDFKYDPHAIKPTLSDVSFTIPEGKVTAIVGASGSGKTTLIKLMLGYYRVGRGRIEIGGKNINEYDMRWWRRQCGVVMQDGVIFSESIARNIAVSDEDVDNARLERSSKIACIHDYVMSLPLKYNTKIGRDGIGLSQGQKQRILIARAVYKNPDFIFLDEATNALDAKNEREIVTNLEALYKGKTVVVVAHRLSTVQNADKIIVVDKGEIVEMGVHASLIEKRGIYYNLIKNQLELGI